MQLFFFSLGKPFFAVLLSCTQPERLNKKKPRASRLGVLKENAYKCCLIMETIIVLNNP